MEQVERAVEMIGKRAGEKSKRRVLGHTAEENCQAVLTLWTERRKPGEICREMGTVERGVALSPPLAVLLEKKSRAGLLRGIDKRLKRLQKNIPGPQEAPGMSIEKN